MSYRLRSASRSFTRRGFQHSATCASLFIPTPSRHVASVPKQPFLRHPLPLQIPFRLTLRYNSTSVSTPNETIDPETSPETPAQEQSSERQEGAYELTFTCKPCKHRSAHHITHHGYFHGSVLITCPRCKSRHVISDHLKIFSDESVTLEDLLREKGESVQKGLLDENGDIEFYDDGTSTREVYPDPGPDEQRRRY